MAGQLSVPQICGRSKEVRSVQRQRVPTGKKQAVMDQPNSTPGRCGAGCNIERGCSTEKVLASFRVERPGGAEPSARRRPVDGRAMLSEVPGLAGRPQGISSAWSAEYQLTTMASSRLKSRRSRDDSPIIRPGREDYGGWADGAGGSYDREICG